MNDATRALPEPSGDDTSQADETQLNIPAIEYDDPVAQLDNGRYLLVERIGAGSIGQVWRGYDTKLQREVAVKTVNLAMSADPTTEARFRREAVATAELDHPNVVKLYDSGVDGATAFIVMEFLRGPNLQTVVSQEGPVPYKEALPLLAQVSAGLGAAHAIGVTHRDIKPANVVLDGPSLSSTPKLVDFGIARLNDQSSTVLTSTMTAIGSAAYMSPEQASGNRVSQASDMYSFGCLTTAVLTGQPPFPGESPVAVARAQVYDAPTPLRQLRADAPQALETLMSALLAKDPAARPNARQTEEALRAIAQHNPDVDNIVNSLLPVVPPTHSEMPTVAIQGVAGATDATTVLGAPSASTTASLRPIDTDMDPHGPDDTDSERRRNRMLWGIVIAVVIIAGLIAGLWFAFGRDDNTQPHAQSVTPATITVTSSPSPSATRPVVTVTETAPVTQPATTAPAAQPATTAPAATTEPTAPTTTAPTATHTTTPPTTPNR